jgi:hypothetical protein
MRVLAAAATGSRARRPLRGNVTAVSLDRDRVLPCELIERQFRFLLRQGETDDDVLSPEQ